LRTFRSRRRPWSRDAAPDRSKSICTAPSRPFGLGSAGQKLGDDRAGSQTAFDQLVGLAAAPF
jgi:hypothetical protein